MLNLSAPTYRAIHKALPRRLPYHDSHRATYALWALSEVERLARYGDVPWSASMAAQGLSYGISTGRLPGAVQIAVGSLDRAGLARLVLDLSRTCECIGDVPAAVIKRYAKEG